METGPEEDIIALLGEVKKGEHNFGRYAYGYLQAWRRADGKMSTTAVYWSIDAGDAEYNDSDLDSIGPQQLRVCFEVANGIESVKIKSLNGPAKDAEMMEFASTLNQPIEYDDEVLGTLDLEPPFNDRFKGSMTLSGSEVKFSLPAIERAPATQALKTLRTLVLEWESRFPKMLSEISQQLNTEQYQHWWSERESGLSESDFTFPIKVEEITLDRNDDNYTVWCTDGGWFGGHGINISGSIREGLGEAYMA